MTREEREQAIAYLETSFMAESNTDGGWSTHHNNVIRTAIKALEQNESAEEWYKLFVEKLEQESTDENLHREREQAYMQGYEDASKKYRQEPNGDVVSRQAAIDAINNHFGFNIEEEYGSAVQEVINGLPSAEQEPKTGHWIFDEIDKHYYCSECKSMGVDYWDYCPKCGAKMIDPQESEEVCI